MTPNAYNTIKMNEIIIRKAGGNDIIDLIAIGKKTFTETFAESNSEYNMKKYLEENFNPEKIENELNNPDSLFYIALDENKTIGYLKLNSGSAQTEPQEDNSLEIERIYVSREYHGKKVGQLLYEKAFEVAHKLKKQSIWLGVWEENPRAIRFYEKNGFTAFDKHIFIMGNDEQTDIMMKKIL